MSTITREWKTVTAACGDAPAFIYPRGKRLVRKSFADLAADIEGKTAYLLQSGVAPGDRILAFAKESYDLCAFMIAAMSIGASILYIDIWAREERLQLGYESFRPAFVVVSEKTAKFKPFFSGINRISRTLYVERSAPPGAVSVPPPEEDTPALITMTTGSTGLPKAAIRTHGHLSEQLKLIRRNLQSERRETVLTTSFMYVFANILNGFTTVLGGFDMAGDSEAGLARKLEALAGVPVTVIFTTPDFCMKTRNPFPGLRAVYIGGAILNLREAEDIRARYPVPVIYIYGATECNLIARTALDDYIATLRATARSCLGTVVEGVSLRTDPEGRILVTSAALLPRYLGRDGMESKVRDAEGVLWHLTGDTGEYRDGLLYYTGRHDMRLPPCGGAFSNEVEQALIVRFADWQKCAALAAGGTLYLFVRPAPGGTVDGAAVAAFLRERFACERVQVRTLRSIPCDVKHHTKIDYRKLAALLPPGGDP